MSSLRDARILGAMSAVDFREESYSEQIEDIGVVIDTLGREKEGTQRMLQKAKGAAYVSLQPKILKVSRNIDGLEHTTRAMTRVDLHTPRGGSLEPPLLDRSSEEDADAPSHAPLGITPRFDVRTKSHSRAEDSQGSKRALMAWGTVDSRSCIQLTPTVDYRSGFWMPLPTSAPGAIMASRQRAGFSREIAWRGLTEWRWLFTPWPSGRVIAGCSSRVVRRVVLGWGTLAFLVHRRRGS